MNTCFQNRAPISLKQKWHGLLICLFFLSLGISAHATSQNPELHNFRFLAFGTYIDIIITGTSKEKASKAFKELEQELLYMDRVWNPYKPSALARLNKMFPGTVWFSMAPSVRNVMVRAKELTESSDELFNPAIGKLIKLWGFHDSNNYLSKPPSKEKIAELVKTRPSLKQIELKGIRIKASNANVQVDLGAIAKGFAANLAIETLKRLGIKNAIVNMGGDLKCIGHRGNRPWRIAIRNPDKKDETFASVKVEGEESIFTSGDYERFFIYQNKRYHHIIDPRTGYPANTTRSVTVIHKDGALADAAATALFIAGPKDLSRIAKRMGVELVLLVDNNGKLHMSKKMQKRLTLYLKTKPTIKIISLK